MLRFTIPGAEYWDAKKEEFIYEKPIPIQLEHSLVSLSKWESKYHKPFLESRDMTAGEVVDYIRFMTLTQNVDPDAYLRINDAGIQQINEYIKDPMTATTSGKPKRRGEKRIITAELLYYQMIALGIPFECQKWHLNKLLMLIRVCEEESAPRKKLSPKEALMRTAAVNAARRKKKG